MIIVIILIIILVLIDQLLKNYVYQKKKKGFKFSKKGLIYTTYLENKGIAFGLLSKKKWLIYIINSIILIFYIVILALVNIKGDILISTALTLLISGGISNFFDRIIRGHVIDYICLKMFSGLVVNFADLYIFIGAFFIMLGLIF